MLFLDGKGHEMAAPGEWELAYIEVPVAIEDWLIVKVRRHDGELLVVPRPIGGRVRVVAEWPRSGVGQYKLWIRVGEVESRSSVEIWPQKIAREEFVQLVDDLESRLPVSLALALQRLGGLGGVELPPQEMTTLEQEVERLRRAIDGSGGGPGLATILPEVSNNPHHMLRTIEIWTRREQARRPHPARLAHAYAKGHNLDEGGQPLKVLDTRVEQNLDVYENRIVKTYHDVVARRLRGVKWRVEAHGDKALIEEAQGLTRRLQRSRREAGFLDGVKTLDHSPKQLTMVLLKRPVYRAALEGYLRFNKSIVVQMDEPLLDSPLNNLPKLYQVWGTLEVISVLLQVGEELGYEVVEQSLVRPDRTGLYMLALSDNRVAVALRRADDGTVVRLIPERSYSRNSYPLRSVSYTQRPDVVVEVQTANGKRRVYLFDPKYKLISETRLGGLPNKSSRGEAGEIAEALDEDLEEAQGDVDVDNLSDANPVSKPKKVDIDKMHAYRDAIRDADGERAVEYAGVLYPGPTVRYGKGIEALQALPKNISSLRAELQMILMKVLYEPDTILLD
ncbi:MAG TPA: DUF2357 domain-containing protein [Chloroflexia bacterium]